MNQGVIFDVIIEGEVENETEKSYQELRIISHDLLTKTHYVYYPTEESIWPISYAEQ